MMIKNFSNEEVKIMENTPSIFLAGPTKRNSNFQNSYRKKACDYLEHIEFNGIVYIPEYIDCEFDESKIETQCLWERKALEYASCILFWIPRNLEENMPGFTTNVEYGIYLERKPHQVVYGRPIEAQKMRYLDWLYKYTKGPNSNIYTSLETSLDKAKEVANWIVQKKSINSSKEYHHFCK